jgi:hypothetical protein
MAQKETNGSNGEHTTRPPPTPSPLRFSKFFQVRAQRDPVARISPGRVASWASSGS